MKTIQFTGTESQLDNLKFIETLQKTETRVYVVNVHNIVNKSHNDLTEEEFINLSELQGLVYTLGGFQKEFNLGRFDIEPHYVIRFINQPIY